ncbi:MAG TPA: hypothetical protein VD929_10600 [Caulobacteraceae bacterium]|nr:hypothetical protein [Caulobacteraceae bacterium]
MTTAITSLIFLAAASTAPVSAPAKDVGPKVEKSCGVLVQKAADKTEYVVVPGLKVMGGPTQLALPADKGQVTAVRCTRDTVVPTQGDGRVIVLNRKPFIIEDATRLVSLEINKGKFQLRPLKGQLTPEETKAVQARLAVFQNNLDTALAQAKAKAQPASALKPAVAPASPAKAPAKK